MRLWLLILLAGCEAETATPDLARPDLSAAVDLAGAWGAACSFVEQRYCREGLRCGVTSAGDRCVYDEVSLPEGSRCAPVHSYGLVTDWCAPGTVCVDWDGQYRCRRACLRRGECPPGLACVGPTTSSSLVNVCVPHVVCDPVSQAGCAAGERCLFTLADDQGRVFTCASAEGRRPPGEPCTSSTQCAMGVMCASLGFCRRLCYLHPPPDAGAADCPANEGICKFFFGSGEYGRCE